MRVDVIAFTSKIELRMIQRVLRIVFHEPFQTIAKSVSILIAWPHRRGGFQVNGAKPEESLVAQDGEQPRMPLPNRPTESGKAEQANEDYSDRGQQEPKEKWVDSQHGLRRARVAEMPFRNGISGRLPRAAGVLWVTAFGEMEMGR